ncbi:MAG: hypothetical protein WC023_15060 [Rhodocyclaceae bacterium]
MTVHMKALKGLVYAGRRLRVGELFEARGESDARVLKAIGSAAVAPTPVAVVFKEAPATYRTRAMVAAPAYQQAPPAAETVADPVSDDLDAMDATELHALAAARGLKLHHLTGAAKVRAALRAAQ